MRSSQNKKWPVEREITVSLAGPDAGVLFSLEQWTHHPHNSKCLFGSRHVLSSGHATPGMQAERTISLMDAFSATFLVTEAHKPPVRQGQLYLQDHSHQFMTTSVRQLHYPEHLVLKGILVTNFHFSI